MGSDNLKDKESVKELYQICYDTENRNKYNSSSPHP